MFYNYLDYVKNLTFTADPDYEYLIGIFVNTIETQCSGIQSDFDWNGRLKSSTLSNFSIKSNLTENNVSMLMNNNNISKTSQNISDIRTNEELNKMSIFQREKEE